MPRALLAEVLGQETAVATIRRALAAARVHHAYLFDGPPGVGKELAALGLAQALVCERRGVDAPVDAACGDCGACRRVPIRAGERRPVHPDVAVLERALYEPQAIGRRTPETQDLSVDQVRTLVLARAAFPPHEGRAKVFVVRRADELSVSAANALLKTLEEPGARTHFVLMTSRPDDLLATIRSRTQRVRFGALPEEIVAKILVARGVDAARASDVARLAGGSVEAAEDLSDPDASAARDAFVAKVRRALDAPEFGAALELAEEAKRAKGELPGWLAALGEALAAEVRARVRANDPQAEIIATRYRLTLDAAEQLAGNASAQLVVEAMLGRMRATFA